ncbi:UPF0503 protein [Hibiscus syriacus]|uniref:UPF0503 protein n=1 Tax=Hibiscus syriacus TaxID=106335 RepID=A0A6A3ADD7_HIBSY|nr:UPF0503 protein [Hibiscus syriacus]
MENAKEFLELNKEEAESVSGLTIHPHRVGFEGSFYEDFAVRGIRVDRVEPGFVSCTFKVPPRLTLGQDYDHGYCFFIQTGDELEIISKVLGRRGGYAGALVLVRNKETGELIAEGRHSLFAKQGSKL